MATPQVENGHTDIANELVEALARIRLSGEESQVLWVILRRTYGWHKKEDQIPLFCFVEATGINRQNVYRALRKLESKKILNGINIDSKTIKTYGINKDYEQWIPESKKIRNQYRFQTESILIPNQRKKKSNTKEKRKIKEKKERYVTFFDIFWKNMPDRNGKKLYKPEALEQYCLLEENELETVNMAALNYAHSERVKDGIGICDPIRFLIKGRGSKKWEPWREWIEPEKSHGRGKSFENNVDLDEMAEMARKKENGNV